MKTRYVIRVYATSEIIFIESMHFFLQADNKAAASSDVESDIAVPKPRPKRKKLQDSDSGDYKPNGYKSDSDSDSADFKPKKRKLVGRSAKRNSDASGSDSAGSR